MKLATLALALGLASPVFAAAPLSVDFEKNWNYGDEVANTYAANGVTFTNVLGLSNDANFSYFSGAPSPLGVAFVQLDGITNTTAYMNVAGGVAGGLSFYASTTADFQVKAYSGLNGSGTLLGTFTVAANTTDYSVWSQKVITFNGVAQSFDLSSANNVAVLDNIAAVPEPGSLALMLAGATVLLARRRRG